MCGIAGQVKSGGADGNLVRHMCDVLAHRGPDEEGHWQEGAVALSMRRLAIIDVGHGQQPIFNEDGSVAVVLNGEIYNFRDLRKGLVARGHRFSTMSDTEVVAHLYEEQGADCVQELRGMFAFAIWDRKRGSLILARDRVGKKPLYYTLTPDGILFASELKALMQDGALPRRVDLEALHHYLTYQYVPAPWSILEGVKKLPPATILTFSAGEAKLQRYWRLSYRSKTRLCEADLIERVHDLIVEATRIRLVSERPVGAFLSGGIDSSLVVAAMAECVSGPVRTFSIGFDEEDFDERSFARKVAGHFGTEHTELVVRPDAVAVLPALAWYFDEPFADSSALPSYYLAKMTRNDVTVALTGDGGDESFGGYRRYLAMTATEKLGLPRPLRLLANRGADLLPPTHWNYRAKALLRLLGNDQEARYLHLMSYFDANGKRALYTGEMRLRLMGVESAAILGEMWRDSDADTLVDRLLDMDVRGYLPGDVLVKVDIATMANSLEARSPLLDHVLMEFMASQPADMKVRGRTTKYILKKVAEKWLPAGIPGRAKMGFGVPVARWLRGELRDMAWDSLNGRQGTSPGVFRAEGCSPATRGAWLGY